MPYFRDTSDRPIIDPFTLVVGNKKTIKLAGLPRANNRFRIDHFSVRSSNESVLEVVPTRTPSETLQDQILKLSAKNTTELVKVQAFSTDGKAAECGDTAVCVTPLQIRIVSPLVLPALDSDEGALARLILAESRSPQYGSYGDGQNVLKAMEWMRIVVENRMNVSSSYLSRFGVKTRTIRGVITAPGQFEGFRDYPKIGTMQQANIDDCLRIANEGSHSYFDKYRIHVQRALDIASGKHALQADTSKNGLYGWMTDDGKSHPGGSFVSTPELFLGGQQFFTVEDGYFK